MKDEKLNRNSNSSSDRGSSRDEQVSPNTGRSGSSIGNESNRSTGEGFKGSSGSMEKNQSDRDSLNRTRGEERSRSSSDSESDLEGEVGRRH